MNFEYLLYTLENRICHITLNRAEKRNALNHQLVTELKQAFKAAEADPLVKVIVLKGAGPSFSAGADLAYLQQLQKNTYEENLADSSNLMELFQMIYELDKVVIAQIEGHAIAGGCGLATVCDFSFSVPEAKFGYTEVKIGFIPAIVSVFLLRKLSESKARELMLTGKLIQAEEAKHIGLINFVENPEDIAEKVQSFATKLVERTSGESLKITKEMIGKVQSMEVGDALQYAAQMNAKARASEDCQKGIAAFLNKEKLTW